MKKKIAWITDSTCSLTQQEAKELGVHIIPSSILFGEVSYRDGIDITNEEFYEKLGNSSKTPTTSQPTIGETVSFFEKLKEEYEMGIAIHVSSKLSGTINGSITASEMSGFPVIALDSQTVADGMVALLKEGISLETKGESVENIARKLNEMSAKNKFYVMIGSLEQLHKGGRLSGAGLLIGNLLQVKPILTLEDGTLVPFDKVRTTKKAEKRILELVEEAISLHNLSEISIIHSCLTEKATEWKDLLSFKYPDININIGNLSPAVGVHVGAGTLGILWFEK